jgi:hypothetical protein
MRRFEVRYKHKAQWIEMMMKFNSNYVAYKVLNTNLRDSYGEKFCTILLMDKDESKLYDMGAICVVGGLYRVKTDRLGTGWGFGTGDIIECVHIYDGEYADFVCRERDMRQSMYLDRLPRLIEKYKGD